MNKYSTKQKMEPISDRYIHYTEKFTEHFKLNMIRDLVAENKICTCLCVFPISFCILKQL